MPRWTIADIGTMQVRAVVVPIYATSAAKQVEYILNNADVKILFVGDQEEYNCTLEIIDACPQIQKIVAMKDNLDLKIILKLVIGKLFARGKPTPTNSSASAS